MRSAPGEAQVCQPAVRQLRGLTDEDCIVGPAVCLTRRLHAWKPHADAAAAPGATRHDLRA